VKAEGGSACPQSAALAVLRRAAVFTGVVSGVFFRRGKEDGEVSGKERLGRGRSVFKGLELS
jgi:hypothetical protein